MSPDVNLFVRRLAPHGQARRADDHGDAHRTLKSFAARHRGADMCCAVARGTHQWDKIR